MFASPIIPAAVRRQLSNWKGNFPSSSMLAKYFHRSCRSSFLVEPRLLLPRSRIKETRVWSRNRSRSSHFQFDLGVSLAGFTNYEEAVRNFTLPVPEFYNFGSDVIDHWARQEQISDVRKGLPAFWWVGEQGQEVKWTFRELSDISKRVANVLTGPCGLRPGDRVMVILSKIPEWWILNIASTMAGIVLLPGTTQLTSNDIRYRFQTSRSKCIITDSICTEKVDEVIGDCDSVKTKVVVGGRRKGWMTYEDLFLQSSNAFEIVRTRSSDPMMIFFTSGTIGYPKMVEHSQASYGLAHKITATYGLDLIPTDIHLNLSDTGWAKSAYSNVFAPWINGSCVFVHSLAKFDPQFTLSLCEKYAISTFCAPPTAFRYMVKENLNKYRLDNLRHCSGGGEPFDSAVIEKWYDGTGKAIHELYGQTETVMSCMSPKCLPMKPGSMGRAAPGMDLLIVDDDGKEVGPNVEGEIALRVKPTRPVGMFTRYVDEPEKTNACFKGDFYVSGDQGMVDEDGYFWFAQRKDDLIISAGYRIGPHEVENALLTHPAVADAAVVASPDEMRGEVVKAFIVLKPDHVDKNQEQLTNELQSHVKQTTAPYKYPRKVEYVDSLPRTISGKLRRSELRKKEGKAASRQIL